MLVSKVQADFSVSTMGNNMFYKTPFRFPRQDYCSFLDTTFRKYFMEAFKPPVTELMYTEDPNEKLCDIFRQNGAVSASIRPFLLMTRTIFTAHVQNQRGVNRLKSSAVTFLGWNV